MLLNGGHGGAMADFHGGFSKKRHRIAVAWRVWDGGRHSHGGRGGPKKKKHIYKLIEIEKNKGLHSNKLKKFHEFIQ